MCTIKDAQRHEQLAEIYLQEKNPLKARYHYLEACSIYVLNDNDSEKNTEDKNNNQNNHTHQLLLKANHCYAQACKIENKPLQKYSRQQLAKITLQELDKFPKIDTLKEIRRML